MPYSIISNVKSRKFFGKIKTDCIKIDPQPHRFWLNSFKEYLQKSWDNSIVYRFLEGIWFHIQRKDGANTSSISFPQRNDYCYNDAFKSIKAMVPSPNGNSDFFFLFLLEYFTYIYIYHHHQIVLTAWISLILSYHPSVSSIACRRSSKLHLVSAQTRCWSAYISMSMWRRL